ncbi:MAG: hypothetical protein ACLVFV_06610 [Clostridium sp.]
MPGADFNLHVQTKRPSAQKPAGVLFVKLGMVGIYKKEIGLGGPDGSSPSGMSMKKLFLFQAILETKACHPFG